ncbi:lipopolysaccharide biosynthesis protein [Sphingomonas panacis]|uniref:lipopolysaccharide biosynthesis protein n=1 Tax=Sphingomonas panacis TaxID=1560345 RepID=UPI0012374CB4|nr:oligosaccharide flippase family protein [Sphingomonas panacis]
MAGSLIRRLGASRMVTNTGAYLLGTVINRLFPLLLVPLYTRVWSTGEFGAWGFCMTVLNVLLIVSGLGLDAATTRLYYDHHDPHEIRRFLVVGFVLRIAVAVGTALLLFAPLVMIWPWISGGAIPPLPFVPLLLVGSSLQAVVAFNLANARAERRARAFIQIQLSQALLQAVASLALVLAGWGAAGAFYGYAIGAGIVALAAGARFLRRNHTPGPLPWGQMRENLAYGIRTLPVAMSTWLRRMADRVIIGRSVSMTDLGLYQLSASGMAPLSVLMGAFNAAYLPFFYEKRRQGEAALPLIAAMDMAIVAVLAMLSVAVMAVTPELIRFLGPPRYAGAAHMTPALVLAVMLDGIQLQFTKELMFHKRPGLASWMTTPPSLLGVVANIILIPHYGAIAAAWIAAIVSATILIGCIAATRRVERTGHDLRRLALACALVAGYALAASEALPVTPFHLPALAVRLGSGALACAAILLILAPGNIRTVLKALGH